MALASEADVELALGRILTEAEDVSFLLECASDLACNRLGYRPGPTDPVVTDGVAKRVVVLSVIAVLSKPAVNAADYGSSGYNVSRETATIRVENDTATTTGPWLSKSQKQMLEPYRRGRRSAYSIDLAPAVSGS